MKLKKIKSYSNIFILIISNIFLILAFSFSNGPKQESVIPKNHKLLLLPIEIFVPLTIDPKSNFVTLYDERDKIVIKKALIHFNDQIGNYNEPNLRLIEIEERDLIKVINFRGKGLRAFPFVDDFNKKDPDSYEFNF